MVPIIDAQQAPSIRREQQSSPRQGWFVDAHVHYHDNFPTARFVGAAFDNVMQTASVAAVDATGCMVLTDPVGHDTFARLLSTPFEGWPPDVRVRATDDPLSALLTRGDGRSIVAVAGRQIVTAERLEVLALGTRRRFRDGEPVRDTLARVADCGALAVVPWGFGKWLFERGRLLRRLLDAEDSPPFHLGDNGGRPRPARTPRLFALARNRGIWNLPGSDPLPFTWQAARVLSYGFFLPCTPRLDAPWQQIRTLITTARTQPELFGRLENTAHFARTQVALRMRGITRWRKQ
jgi:hypothetical protein